ncbi:MAG: beta-galactosidase, partial [Acidobacteria bacterium]
HSPSLALDYKRFFSDSTDDYLKLQAGILRRISPSKAITHNEMGLFDGIDYSKLNESLDFVAWDNYPMFESDYTSFYGPALGHDLTRGSKYNQNFMVMEEQGGLPGWQIFWGRQAPAALYRLWAYQAVAHGADAVCFFRWRTSRYGTEQYWQGVLDQDSYPNARYQIVKQMGGELPKLTELLQGSKVASHVALLVSPDSRWAFHIQPLVEGAGAPGGSKVNFDYNRELRQYYDAVRRLGLNVDVVFPQTDFSAYKAIIAPSLFVTDPALVARLKQFVEQGGTLALTYRSGVKDEHNVVTDKTLPGPLAELAGVAIHEFDPQTNQEQEIEAGDAGRFPARVWFDILEPATAEVLATYTKGYYAGKAAVTRNRVGRGTVYYVGTESSSDAFYDHEAEALAKEVGIAIGPKLPVGVEMVTREKGGNPIVFLLNYTESAQTVKLDGTYRNALTGEAESGAISIPPLDVKILSASK